MGNKTKKMRYIFKETRVGTPKEKGKGKGGMWDQKGPIAWSTGPPIEFSCLLAKTYGLSMLPTYLDLTKGQDIRHGTSIEERAVEIVVPGNFSIGCNFGVLTIVNNGNKDDYDQFGCLAAYNVFIKYYNQRLN
ncbi:hypothetical protein JHK86_004861 [Glycine max]|nr:hypothetical protein JHK86_004861 [Glycine max]